MIRYYLGDAASLWATARRFMVRVPVVRRLFRELGIPLRAPGEHPRRVDPAPYLVPASRYAAPRRLHQRLKIERLSRDTYLDLVERQRGACEICTLSFDPQRGPEVFDRIAPGAAVRALICRRCADLIRLAGRDVLLFRRASAYLAGSATASNPIHGSRLPSWSGPHPGRLLELTLSKKLTKSERQQVLLYLAVGELDSVSNRQLATVFGVDEKQIRTDLAELGIQRPGAHQSRIAGRIAA